jgi:Gas vesicle synthesis protein GvpL/GvpF
VTAAARPQGASGWYVYGVVPTAEAPANLFDGIAGVGGAPVKLVGDGRLAAIATEVPLREFGEEAIAQNLRDPEWLESRVRGHDAVLETAVGAVPVVPFRFGTIYRGEDEVRAMLSEHERLSEALDRVRGRVELGVKAFLAAAAAVGEAADDETSASAGRRYLEEKQRARRLADEREALRARWADETHARLAAVAEAATANPLQPRELSERDEEMFLNGAYLVPLEREQAFRAALAELDTELGPSGARFELTGPWPPYNFVEDPA